MADPWAAFNPIGGSSQPVRQQPAAPISGASDPWAAFNPINQKAAPAQERGVMDKLTGASGPRYQTWPERLVRSVGSSVYSAATLPGDVMAGKIAPDPSDPHFIERSLDFAGIATPLKPRVATSIKPVSTPTREMLDASADAGYDAVRASGVEYHPSSVADSMAGLAQGLEARGRSDRRAPETHALIRELGSPPEGAVSVPITGIDIARQELGAIAADHTKSASERAAAEIAKRHLDGYMGSVHPSDVLAGDAPQAAQSLKNAQRDYAAARRSETITDLEQAAERQAARSNSGMNVDNTLRRKVGGILDSEKKSYGFSPEELARIEQINSGTPLGNTLRNTGNALGGGGGMLAAMYGLSGALYNPYIAATPVVGALLKKGGDYVTRRAIDKLDEATRMRSALGEDMASGAPAMTPAEQLRQSAMIKGLLSANPHALPGQQELPSPNDQVMARFLMGYGR